VEGGADGRAWGGGVRERERGKMKREMGRRRCLGQKEGNWAAGTSWARRPKGRERERFGEVLIFFLFFQNLSKIQILFKL
jgi:hypothetical protein